MARSISTDFSWLTERPVVVENLPGADGIAGTLQLLSTPKGDFTLALARLPQMITANASGIFLAHTSKDKHARTGTSTFGTGAERISAGGDQSREFLAGLRT